MLDLKFYSKGVKIKEKDDVKVPVNPKNPNSNEENTKKLKYKLKYKNSKENKKRTDSFSDSSSTDPDEKELKLYHDFSEDPTAASTNINLKHDKASGNLLYDAMNPTEFIKKSRSEMKQVEKSFDNCFSYAFISESEMKRFKKKHQDKKSTRQKKSSKATNDYLEQSIRQLKSIQSLASSQRNPHSVMMARKQNGNFFARSRGAIRYRKKAQPGVEEGSGVGAEDAAQKGLAHTARLRIKDRELPELSAKILPRPRHLSQGLLSESKGAKGASKARYQILTGKSVHKRISRFKSNLELKYKKSKFKTETGGGGRKRGMSRDFRVTKTAGKRSISAARRGHAMDCNKQLFVRTEGTETTPKSFFMGSPEKKVRKKPRALKIKPSFDLDGKGNQIQIMNVG